MITLNHFHSESTTVSELAAALGVGIRAVQARAVSEQWRFPLEGLPGDARAAVLALRQQKAQRRARVAGRFRWLRQPAPGIAQRQEAFQRASKARRDRAEQRAAFLVQVAELVKSGASLKDALNMTSGNLPAGDVSIAPSGSYPEAVKDVGRGHITFPSERQGLRWWCAVKGIPREHWPAFLLPEERNANRKAAVHPAAWAWFQDQYQGADRPSVASCYQQLKDAAQHHPEWAPLPSLRSFQRRAKEVQP